MGEAARRKQVGNISPDPNWRRKLTPEEIREAVQRGVEKGIADINYMWNDMNKTKK